MARFLVSMNYRGKDYAVTITASDEQNAIEFAKDDCIRVAQATEHDYAKILDGINDNCFNAVMI